MAWTRKAKAGRVKYPVSNFVGSYGQIFYNEETGELFISDGETPGGMPVLTREYVSGLKIDAATLEGMTAEDIINSASTSAGIKTIRKPLSGKTFDIDHELDQVLSVTVLDENDAEVDILVGQYDGFVSISSVLDMLGLTAVVCGTMKAEE